MNRIACFVAALALVLATEARAQSSGVPYLDGAWSGKISAKVYDQTIGGSNDSRRKYKSKVDVEILQAPNSPDLIVSITFEDALPTGDGSSVSQLTVTGSVGNFHMNIVGVDDDPLLVGSGDIDKKAKKIRMEGTAATSEYTLEFKLKLKLENN